jgi:hypothetical protein
MRRSVAEHSPASQFVGRNKWQYTLTREPAETEQQRGDSSFPHRLERSQDLCGDRERHKCCKSCNEFGSCLAVGGSVTSSLSATTAVHLLMSECGTESVSLCTYLASLQQVTGGLGIHGSSVNGPCDCHAQNRLPARASEGSTLVTNALQLLPERTGKSHKIKWHRSLRR